MPKGHDAIRPHSLLPYLIFCLFFALAGGSASAGENVYRPSVDWHGPNLSFAIADFDGDLHPDIVTVLAATNNSRTSNYSIQLRLSAIGQHSIQLVAPAGGLQIEARDVDGNHAIDLVLRTAWFKLPVAIFLNDGHGGFSRAEPADFPDVFAESDAGWASGSDVAIDLSCVVPQPNVGICAKEGNWLHERCPAEFITPLSAGFPQSPFLVPQAERPPPPEVLYR
jgi:hypothetical protein